MNKRWRPLVGLPEISSIITESNVSISSSDINKISVDNHLIEVKAHHFVRHDSEAKKPPKHSLDDSVILGSVLCQQCDCKSPCYLNYSVKDIVEIRKEFDYDANNEEKTENEISVTLLHYLECHSFPAKCDGSHMVGKKHYRFVFSCHPGVYLCPRAFCKIIGVCEKKLRSCACFGAEYGTSLPYPLPDNDEKYAPKTDQIRSFLSHVKQHLTHEVECERNDGTLFKYDSLIGFHERIDLFNFYKSMISNHSCYTWFNYIWREKFPNLHASTDRPCVSCNDFLEKIKEYEKKGDFASVAAERSRMDGHLGMFHFRSLLYVLMYRESNCH